MRGDRSVSRRPVLISASLGVALLALSPAIASPAVDNTPAAATVRRPAFSPEVARIQRDARKQALDLRRDLVSFEGEVQRREAGDSWNKWLRYKLADTLGRLWSAQRDLERSLAAAPLEIERQSAVVRSWQPALDRLRDLEARLRQRDAERDGRPSPAPLVVLPPGTGSLSGRVTDAVTGLGVDSGVELYDADGSWVDAVNTDAAGRYAFAPLPPGGYHVKTSAYGRGRTYLDELYADMPCLTSCDVTSGTVVPVTAGASTTGVDFVLDRGGIVSGRVTAAESGLGIPTDVYILDASGQYAGSGYSDSNGSYSSTGLLPGSCYAVAASSGLYLWQLYQGLPCASGTCDFTTGTPIGVVRNGVTSGIDFPLPRGGQVAGRVTDQASGVALEGVSVTILDAAGAAATEAQTNANGEYISEVGLETGTYLAIAFPPRPHLAELYRDLPCFDGQCEPTSGTAIAVVAGATTVGVDFGLPRGGGVSGRVTDATNGAGVAASIYVFDTRGSTVATLSAATTGSYEVVGLPPGNYFVRADPVQPYLGELFDGVPCYDGGCDPTTGTPVPVALGATAAGIDLAVRRGGSVSGTVVDETSGAPVAGASIAILGASGAGLGYGYTDALGSYIVTGLVPGNVFVSAWDAGSYWPELYDGVPCSPSFSCGVPAGGTPVPVPLGGAVAGVDFALSTVSAAASGFFAVEPCRAVDTRGANGPALDAGTERVFNVTSYLGSCMGHYGARAVSVNLTVVGADAPGNVRLYAAGGPVPATSTLNYAAGATRSNNAVVPLNAQGELAVYVTQASGHVHLIIDLNGYFE